jgi:hypothetical protein
MSDLWDERADDELVDEPPLGRSRSMPPRWGQQVQDGCVDPACHLATVEIRMHRPVVLPTRK